MKGWMTMAVGIALAVPAALGAQGINPDEFYPGKGVGPVDTVVLADTLDPELVKKGEEIFKLKCTACHQLDQRVVGPPLRGITKRRRPEWIMNMILNPTEMVQKDDLAKTLLGMYYVPMTNQNVTEEDARALLEYFRQVDAEEKK